MQKKKSYPKIKARRNRKPWTFEVVIADGPPGDVEGFLDCYARVLIHYARKIEAEQAPLRQVA